MLITICIIVFILILTVSVALDVIHEFRTGDGNAANFEAKAMDIVVEFSIILPVSMFLLFLSSTGEDEFTKSFTAINIPVFWWYVGTSLTNHAIEFLSAPYRRYSPAIATVVVVLLSLIATQIPNWSGVHVEHALIGALIAAVVAYYRRNRKPKAKGIIV